MTNWESLEFRIEFLKSINTNENKERKAKSLQEYEIYNGNISQYVQAYLTEQLSAQTVKRMPIISSIDICKRIADQEASVYRQQPKREFSDISEADLLAVEELYNDCGFDIKMNKSNRYYKLQSQSLIQVLPKDDKIDLRVLFPHNFDAIPNMTDPERAESIVISAFNKENYVQGDKPRHINGNFVTGSSRDSQNQISADEDDYKSAIERYVVWSDKYNFIMDGKGKILSEEIENPIGKLPFVDIAQDKDYNFFVNRGSQLSIFAIQYNAALSDLANIVRMQAYSQAVLIAPKDAMPENIVVGPTSIIKLAIDPNSPAQTDFKFVSPSPDLAGSIQFIEVLISNFLSSRGLSASTVSGKATADKFSSGIERFLSMIDRFEATKSDFSLYDDAERQVYDLVKMWLVYYSGTPYLNKKYNVSAALASSYLKVHFAKPEAIQSESEKLAVIQQKLELGLIDDVEALMFLNDISKTEAIERLDEIQQRSMEKQPSGVVPDEAAQP